MKICITGGAGFIGSHVAALFLSEGHEVVAVDNFSTGKVANVPDGVRIVDLDITKDGVYELFERERFDAVNHHAGQIELRTSVRKPVYDAEVNILGSLRVFDAAYNSGVRHITTASSAGGVYGDQEHYPATEADTIHPISPYGVAKCAMELYANYYAALGAMKVVNLRYTNVYGPRQNPFGEAGVIAIFYERWLSGKEATVYGDGEQLRDYVHVTDVARANSLALKNTLEGAFNVCTNTETSLNQLLVEMKKSFVDIPSPVVYGPPKPGDPPRGLGSYDLLKSTTGWEPSIALSDGIRETAEWFQSRPR